MTKDGVKSTTFGFLGNLFQNNGLILSLYYTSHKPYTVVSNVSFLSREMVSPSGTRFIKLSMVDID